MLAALKNTTVNKLGSYVKAVNTSSKEHQFYNLVFNKYLDIDDDRPLIIPTSTLDESSSFSILEFVQPTLVD